MSERKTSEVKFRCTPTFKAGLQAAAEAAGESVSEYLEAAAWARQNAQLSDTRVVDIAIGSFAGSNDAYPTVRALPWASAATPEHSPESEQALALEGATPEAEPQPDAPPEQQPSSGGLLEFISNNVMESTPLTREVLDRAVAQAIGVPPTCTCRPWEFCTHKVAG